MPRTNSPQESQIFAWFRLDNRLTTSGQPSEDQLVSLAKMGVRHIINLGLHSHEKALPDEAASVAALGMNYIHIPVDFDAPTDQDFRIFVDAMQRHPTEKIHIHCIVNARVSAFLYRYRRDILGVPEAQARQSLNALWHPGGKWAAFIGDEQAVTQPHVFHMRQR